MSEDLIHLSQRVRNYIKYRPHYPEAILYLLKAQCQLTNMHVIADVGSGTGILSELFLKNGNVVFGVEPDPDMRAGAEYSLKNYPNFTSLPGSAETTTLPSHLADFIVVGQAFHWFDLEQARREFKRVLFTQGWVVLVSNLQKAAGTPFLDALQKFWEDERFQKRSPRRSSQQMERAQAYRLNFELARDELFDPFFGVGMYAHKAFKNPLACNLDGLKGRILSNASALRPGDPLYTTMLEEIEKIFLAHQVNGTVTIEHDTHVVYGQLL